MDNEQDISEKFSLTATDEPKISLRSNKSVRERAMMLYFSKKFSPTEICSSLNIQVEEFGLYVFGENRNGESKTCWKYLRETNKTYNYLDTYVAIKPDYIKKTEKRILDKMNDALDDIDESEDKLDTKDLGNLAATMEKMDKMGRLEEGKATSHVASERRTFTLRDIVDEKKDDEVIDNVEFKEIKK